MACDGPGAAKVQRAESERVATITKPSSVPRRSARRPPAEFDLSSSVYSRASRTDLIQPLVESHAGWPARCARRWRDQVNSAEPAVVKLLRRGEQYSTLRPLPVRFEREGGCQVINASPKLLMQHTAWSASDGRAQPWRGERLGVPYSPTQLLTQAVYVKPQLPSSTRLTK